MISTPSAPDPVETASAQADLNLETATQQQLINMVDQNTPYGSLNYEQTGSNWYQDASGQWVEVPAFTATTTLSPEQQAIYDETSAASLNLAELANQQSDFLGEYLGTGIDLSGAPDLRTSSGMRTSMGPGYQTGVNLQTSLGPNYRDTVGSDYRTGVNLQSSLGPGYQTGVNLRDTYAGADDFSADRQQYTDALMARMAPQQQQDEAALRTQLINQGIRPGTAAWDAEWNRHQQGVNDARLAAILAGGDEQARMVGMARDAAQFGNEAALAGGGFANEALLNQGNFTNAANLTGAQFTNDALLGRLGAENEAALGRGAFENEALLAEAGFGNAALANQFAMENDAALQDSTFANNARAQYLNEAYAARNQPINEIAALLSGAQVQNPQFQSTPQAGVAGVDYTGLVNQQYQAELQSSQAAMGGLFGLLAAPFMAFSDIRLKTDIRRIGSTDDGVPLYVFRYKDGGPYQVGVMAHEVPEDARVMDASGFWKVDYRKVH